jgi:phosphohistidine phosphatase SixA
MNAATFLVSKGIEPDLIVYSPARRTRESLDIIKRVCSRRILVRTLEFELLYQGAVENILDACCLGDGIEHLMVLAHNPGLTDFLHYLVTNGDLLLEQRGGVIPATMVAVEPAYEGNILIPRKGKVLAWYSP